RARVADEDVEAPAAEAALRQVEATLEELRGHEAVTDALRLVRREPGRGDRAARAVCRPVDGRAGGVVSGRRLAVDAVGDGCASEGAVGAPVPPVDVDVADGTAVRERRHDEEVTVGVVAAERSAAA